TAAVPEVAVDDVGVAPTAAAVRLLEERGVAVTSAAAGAAAAARVLVAGGVAEGAGTPLGRVCRLQVAGRAGAGGQRVARRGLRRRGAAPPRDPPGRGAPGGRSVGGGMGLRRADRPAPPAARGGRGGASGGLGRSRAPGRALPGRARSGAGRRGPDRRAG